MTGRVCPCAPPLSLRAKRGNLFVIARTDCREGRGNPPTLQKKGEITTSLTLLVMTGRVCHCAPPLSLRAKRGNLFVIARTNPSFFLSLRGLTVGKDAAIPQPYKKRRDYHVADAPRNDRKSVSLRGPTVGKDVAISLSIPTIILYFCKNLVALLPRFRARFYTLLR